MVTKRPSSSFHTRGSHLQNINGSRATPRLLVLSFYSILKHAPIIQEGTRLHFVPQVNQPHSHICLPRDQRSARASRCLTIAHLPHVLHNTPLHKRSYTSCIGDVISEHLVSRSKKAATPILDKPVDEKASQALPDRSILNPPKQAPSVWQIFFTDWLQSRRLQCGEGQKLNVVQEAKAAGRAYNDLSDEDREDLAARAKILKENYERELTIWKRGLTPADVERENAFRTAQRKSGKSRKKNINDPNAPKRPLSPYFLYLQAIRADPHMVKDVFGDVIAPIQQSVLAAAKWRGMSEVEKRPYVEKAKSAKMTYDAEREVYENKACLNRGPLTSFLIYSDVDSPSPIAEQEDQTSKLVYSEVTPRK